MVGDDPCQVTPKSVQSASATVCTNIKNHSILPLPRISRERRKLRR